MRPAPNLFSRCFPLDNNAGSKRHYLLVIDERNGRLDQQWRRPGDASRVRLEIRRANPNDYLHRYFYWPWRHGDLLENNHSQFAGFAYLQPQRKSIHDH